MIVYYCLRLFTFYGLLSKNALAKPAEHIDLRSASVLILSLAHSISGIRSTTDLCKKAKAGLGLFGRIYIIYHS